MRSKGRPIVNINPYSGKHEELQPDTSRLIDASRLVSNFATTCTNNAKARVRFWHECGRLFYPTLPKFAKNHNLKGQSKILHRLFDDLGSSACYVIAYVMANWPKDGSRKSPDMTGLEAYGAEYFHGEWLKVVEKVKLPPTKRAHDLAGKRYMPHKKAEFDAMYQSMVLQVVEQNTSADTLSSQDPDEFVFVAGPSSQSVEAVT